MLQKDMTHENELRLNMRLSILWKTFLMHVALIMYTLTQYIKVSNNSMQVFSKIY